RCSSTVFSTVYSNAIICTSSPISYPSSAKYHDISLSTSIPITMAICRVTFNVSTSSVTTSSLYPYISVMPSCPASSSFASSSVPAASSVSSSGTSSVASSVTSSETPGVSVVSASTCSSCTGSFPHALSSSIAAKLPVSIKFFILFSSLILLYGIIDYDLFRVAAICSGVFYFFDCALYLQHLYYISPTTFIRSKPLLHAFKSRSACFNC